MWTACNYSVHLAIQFKIVRCLCIDHSSLVQTKTSTEENKFFLKLDPQIWSTCLSKCIIGGTEPLLLNRVVSYAGVQMYSPSTLSKTDTSRNGTKTYM